MMGPSELFRNANSSEHGSSSIARRRQLRRKREMASQLVGKGQTLINSDGSSDILVNDESSNLEDEYAEGEQGKMIHQQKHRSFVDDGINISHHNTEASSPQRARWWTVYAMHTLFMWSARTYEFATILIVASAFPKTLTATSIRGMTSTLSVLICSSAIGSWIDRSPHRLRTLVTLLSINHVAIVVSYLCWLLWPLEGNEGSAQPGLGLFRTLLFVAILLLDIAHDLTAIGYKFSLERDWVPVLVGASAAEHGLTQVNSVLMRIELLCKLVAPSLLPFIVNNITSRTLWIFMLAVMTMLFWGFGVWAANIIAQGNVQLQLPKQLFTTLNGTRNFNSDRHFAFPALPSRSWPRRLYGFFYRGPLTRLKLYFSFPIWPASISIALLQMTVLAYSATLITYLLEIDFSLSAITVARASGSILGLMGTVMTPLAAKYLKSLYFKRVSQCREIRDDHSILAEKYVARRIGFWGVASQFTCLVPVMILIWTLSTREPISSRYEPSSHVLITVTLFACLSLSRIGHFVNYLMVQQLGQAEIPVSQRSTFAGVEQSFKSLGELSHWIATAVWNRPQDFRWLALGSLLVTGLSTSMFGIWVRSSKENPTENGSGYESIPLADIDDSGHEDT